MKGIMPSVCKHTVSVPDPKPTSVHIILITCYVGLGMRLGVVQFLIPVNVGLGMRLGVVQFLIPVNGNC